MADVLARIGQLSSPSVAERRWAAWVLGCWMGPATAKPVPALTEALTEALKGFGLLRPRLCRPGSQGYSPHCLAHPARDMTATQGFSADLVPGLIEVLNDQVGH